MAPETVVYATDLSYQMHTAVSLTSLLATNPHGEFDVLILGDKPTPRFASALAELARTHSATRIRHVPTEDFFDSAPLTLVDSMRYVTSATYYRFLLDRVLPPECDRVLYLDGDTIVRHPLDELLTADLGDAVLGAVPQLTMPPEVHADVLGLTAGGAYFNAGVLRVDLRRWREEDVTEHCLAALDRLEPAQLAYNDQDILNSVCRDRWAPLPPTFNRTPWTALPGTLPDPVIAHFAGPDKPWSFAGRPAFRDEYWRWLDRTPYRGYRPEDTPGPLGRFRLRAVRVRHALGKGLSRTQSGRRLRRVLQGWRRSSP